MDPPKLNSSICSRLQSNVIIRPIAFKPVVPSSLQSKMYHRVSSTSPLSSSESTESNNNQTVDSNGSVVDSSLSTTTKSYMSQSQGNLSRSSFSLEDENWYSELVLKFPDTPGYISRGKVRRTETFNSDDLTVNTPSPSDSGIIELEGLLREKDSEISYLRETLEQNEQVIFKVYEEKEQSWKRELKKLRQQYEANLTTIQQRLAKAEQRHTLAAQQAQSEKHKQQSESDDLKKANHHLETKVGQLQEEVSSLRLQLDETLWTLCEKTAEISLLESQLKDLSANLGTKDVEFESMKSQLIEAEKLTLEINDAFFESHEIGPKNQDATERKLELNARCGLQKALEDVVSEKEENVGYSSHHEAYAELKTENDHLRYQLEKVLDDYENTKQSFTGERNQWNEEKERVILYQKQLNANYVQLMKKNKELEVAVRQSTKVITRSSNNNESHC
ncbi:Leucine zipper putative tumor suppressor 3 [Halotydeus destructor]|nr:Leucine zipper putative tumor suppressor 3 [Halotydeus destructor]